MMFQRIERYFSMSTPEGRERLFRLAQYVSYGMLMLGAILILVEIINGGLN
ncbi:MAG: hypothetical protein ABR986_09375 [Methanomassiliicoccales archaeon]|jgi:hypothetical protein